jgi:predicted metalloprotease
VLIGGAEMMNRGSYQQPYEQTARRTGVPSDRTGQFVAAVLGNTEDVWTAVFKEGGQSYRPPRLRLYSGSEQGGCGFAQAAMGPFYCPNDRRIYLDTSFFRDMQVRFHGCSGKACEFAEAYVIAHEVGHHVQNLLGVLPKAQNAQRAASGKAAANRIQVRIELQADCFGGVWANRSNQRWKSVEPGDVEAALQTASAGLVYPRHLGAAHALVLDRFQGRQCLGVQHVRRGTAVICHSGARALAREPGIHTPQRTGLWIPGSPLCGAPE